MVAKLKESDALIFDALGSAGTISSVPRSLLHLRQGLVQNPGYIVLLLSAPTFLFFSLRNVPRPTSSSNVHQPTAFATDFDHFKPALFYHVTAATIASARAAAETYLHASVYVVLSLHHYSGCKHDGCKGRCVHGRVGARGSQVRESGEKG